MKTFKVWMEGYSVNGNRATAKFKGKFQANTFQEACDMAFEGDKYYDRDKLDVWGCKLYPTEDEARVNFG